MTSRRRSDSQHVDYLYPCYAGGCVVTWLVYRNFVDCGFSTFLTLSVGIQFFAFLALVLNVYQRKSVSGLSENMIILQACEFGFRLSSTMWLRGYLPADATGQWMYQFCDIAALCCTLLILRAVKLFQSEDEADRNGWFPTWQTILGCLVMAIIIHPDLNDRPFFDIMWTTSLYINVISMLPQLFVLHKCGDEVDALTVHFIAAMTLSRIISMIFWCYAFDELRPEEGVNAPGFAVVGAHCLQLVVMADFIYYYVQALGVRAQFYRVGGRLGR